MLCHFRLLNKQLSQQLLKSQLNAEARASSQSVLRSFSQKKTSPASSSPSEENSNEPVEFFGSQAATWRAKDTRSGGADESLWYQPYVISGSLAIFLIYFCIVREESDIDKRLEGNLFEQVSGLEEVQLTVNYKYNKQNGLDTKELEKRLTELGIDVKQLKI